jgi:hypothetical protein
MSNIFKVNSRFASLMEDKQDNPEINNRKGNKNDTVYGERMNNRFKKTENDRKSKFGGDKKSQQAIILNDNNFPTLTSNNDKTSNNTNVQPENTTFIEKLTAVTIDKDKDKDITNSEEYILPGWLVMKRDKETNKSIKRYGETTIFKKTNATCYEIIEKLAFLHDKRTEDYINTWGQDEYEKMFRFPNYDYDYFERLEQEYEEELEQLREYELLKYYSEEDYYDDYY